MAAQSSELASGDRQSRLRVLLDARKLGHGGIGGVRPLSTLGLLCRVFFCCRFLTAFLTALIILTIIFSLGGFSLVIGLL